MGKFKQLATAQEEGDLLSQALAPIKSRAHSLLDMRLRIVTVRVHQLLNNPVTATSLPLATHMGLMDMKDELSEWGYTYEDTEVPT